MRLRTFGGDPVQVSEIGLGCWQIGGDQWGDVSDTDALATLRAAVDTGTTFLDTADVYGAGRSEELVGRFLRERPGRLFVATKLGRFPRPGLPENCTPANLRAHTEASLRRLGVDALDLTQLHCVPQSILERGEVFNVMRALKAEGKIKRWGASVESTAEARLCLAQEGLASLQVIFNVFRQTPDTAIFDEARRKGVAIIVRLPLASGLLAGKYTPASTFAPGDHRSYNQHGEKFNVGETFAGLGFEKGLDVTNKLRPFVPPGYTMAQFALRWCLDFSAVSVIIPGARNPEQAKANASATTLPPLSADLHERLRRFYKDEVAAHVRGPD
ncbi:aldo/keto reductase [Fimbriiglobus ruber]|uniref:Aldo/keto reductase n=1 Tax=Fimbriiglobus ruber TaxID=1908690 RepID=A0A225E351_9BACT|nr:aldo/keto reductase [Fimbriiglobus ruber]OWK43105.1 aldo/keto reductase [Fimbriiglobus ruber]